VPQLVNAIGKDRISRPTVHRIDKAESVPSIPVVTAWLNATQADNETRARVLDIAERVHRETVPWADLIGDRTSLQDDVAEREQTVVRSRNFQPTVVPGLLQFAGYTRRLVPITSSGLMDPEAVTLERQRRQSILREPGRSFQFIVAESALRGMPVDLADDQSAWMAQLAQLPTVDLAVLPLSAWVGTPWHNFVLHETSEGALYVTTELIHGAQQIVDDDDVAWYTRLWERLWAAAASGDEALALIGEARP
jgi:hypothetical protein